MGRFSRKQWLGLSAVAGAGLVPVGFFVLADTARDLAMAEEPENDRGPASKAVRVDVIHPAYGGVERVVDYSRLGDRLRVGRFVCQISGYLQMQMSTSARGSNREKVLAEMLPEFDKQVDRASRRGSGRCSGRPGRSPHQDRRGRTRRRRGLHQASRSRGQADGALDHEFREKQYKCFKEAVRSSIDRRAGG